MLKISDVISVIQDLPRPRQAEILDQLYDKLDTELRRDQLEIFSLTDVQLLSRKPGPVIATEKVTRLSVIFSDLRAENEAKAYAMTLPFSQVIENYKENTTDTNIAALAYVVVTKNLEPREIIRNIEGSVSSDSEDERHPGEEHVDFLIDIVLEALAQNKPDPISEVAYIINEFESDEHGDVISYYFHHILIKVGDNEASREFVESFWVDDDISVGNIVLLLGNNNMKQIVLVIHILGFTVGAIETFEESFPYSTDEYIGRAIEMGYVKLDELDPEDGNTKRIHVLVDKQV